MNLLKHCAVLAACLLCGCNDSSAPSAKSGQPETVEIQYSNSFGAYRALVHIPANYDPDVPAPVVVNVHGCMQTAEMQQAGTLLDVVSEREGVIAVYPDFVDQPTHPLGCWRFYSPTEWLRSGGDTEGIASLTRMVMERWTVDPERVYVMGLSAGAFMSSILGATYPDLYAAIGVLAGGPYTSTLIDAFNPVGPAIDRSALQAQLAHLAMGSNARVVPLLEIHGDIDFHVPPQNGVHAVKQWLMTNNLVLSGAADAPLALTPAQTLAYGADDVFPYEIDDYHDAEGCLIARHIRIAGLEHFWPGGADDPTLPGFIEPRAMNATEAAWEFFRRYRKSGTAAPCTEGMP